MNKTIRYILYAVIAAICVMAIFVGVYALVFRDYKNSSVTTR